MTPDARLAEINQFLGFALARWPQERSVHAAELSRRCAGCIVNERYAKLQDGLCPRCHVLRDDPQRRQQQAGDATTAEQDALAELDAIIYAQQGAGIGAYDALVLFSGGKDSTYLLQRLQSEYPQLRMLAVMIDNGFASVIARANVERVTRLLEIDLHIVRPRPSLFRRTFRHALTHLQAGGCYATVDRMDGDLTFDIARNLAARLEIPCMIAGMSREQVELIFGLDTFESPREQERQRRTSSAGFPLDGLYTPEERRDCWWDGSRWSIERVPRVLYPLQAWNPSEQHIRSEILRLGLLEEGQDNPLATNSDLIPVMLAVDCAKLGFATFEPEFARMVREGKADRETWLNIFQALEFQAQHGNFLPGCIDATLQRLQLTRQELGIPVSLDLAASHA